MSGICGIVFRDKEQRLTPALLTPMVRALDPSGQEEGFTATLGRVSLGAQVFPGRMSGISQLSVYGQPAALAFHGSLYNLRELFPMEEENRDPYKGLLNLFLKEGMGFLKRLRGEFILAIWDGREEALYLATDRFRVHPLFYYQDQEKLLFASRMKAILTCPFPAIRTVNPEAVVDVVASSIIPAPKTIFREVKKLPPGHFLKYQKGEVKIEPYWEVSFLHPSRESEPVLAERFRTCLNEAVFLSLEVDKNSNRAGTFLSGGVDSSTVTGLLTQRVGHPVKSFSIGFDEPHYNEMEYARIAARAFGAEHYEYFVTAKDTYDVFPVLLEGFDEPYGNASAVPAYFCAKLAKEKGVDFLYAGDGGDELFAGNERYGSQRVFDYYYKFPAWLREALVKPMVYALAHGLKWDLFRKGEKYIQRASIPYHERIFSYDFFKVVPITEFLEEELLDTVGREYNPYGLYSFYYFQAPAQNDLDRHLFIDWNLTLSDNDIVKVTRMTEAAGVTVRFPFLDYRVAEFSTTVPAKMKMQGAKLRTFQKKAYADLLPLAIRKKKKHGFGLPISIWLRTDKRLNEMMLDLVLSPQSFQRGYFRKQALEDLVRRHRTDSTPFYGTVLWNLMVLELWHRHRLGAGRA